MTLNLPASRFNTGVLSAEREIEMPTTVHRDEIFTHAQPLRAHAFLLVGDRAMADDLAEETLRTAWRDFASFPPSDNLRGWLFTILGTVLGSSPIAELSGPATIEETGAGDLLVRPIGLQDLAEFRRALAALPVIEREALLLTVAAGFSNEDAASICGCSVEAILDRADRGRQSLADRLAPH
ncbi:sigma factor-like helix-turn-helix DNA-binding protein [Rhodobacter sp. SY28-1]|uniref:sigma factor-like helix-turn-helix DNA-binding protein n=1 Tax=Rhodobacter sp. SY28-1 TaxID=2562317 RepID=UPI0010C03445|nr:sigma factor-like helix-turn-helix DNA-binding protein [Rhodobacter sp. SY28-1]